MTAQAPLHVAVLTHAMVGLGSDEPALHSPRMHNSVTHLKGL